MKKMAGRALLSLKEEEALHVWMTATYMLPQGNTVLSRENAYPESVRITELIVQNFPDLPTLAFN